MNRLFNENEAVKNLLREILGQEFERNASADKDIEAFLLYLSTPRDKEDVRKYLKHLIEKDRKRATTEDDSVEPRKIYVNKEKKTMAVVWNDGTSTVSKCHNNDEFDFSVGYALCFAKKVAKENGVNYKKYLENHLKDITVYQEKVEKVSPKKTKDVKKVK